MLHDQALSLWPHELPFVDSSVVLKDLIIFSSLSTKLLEPLPIPKSDQIGNVRLKIGDS